MYIKSSITLQIFHLISFPDPPFFPPFITNHTQVIENNPATIPCPAVGTPPPLITWYKNDVLLTGDETGVTFLDDGGLELYNVDAKDTATYKCVATNAAGETEHSVDLHVLSIISSFPNNSQHYLKCLDK